MLTALRGKPVNACRCYIADFRKLYSLWVATVRGLYITVSGTFGVTVNIIRTHELNSSM